MLHVFAQVEWPSAIVAIVLLLIIAAILIVAMFRYDLDGVLKIWAAAGTLFGVVIGSMATYFFANQAHQARSAQFQEEKRALNAEHKLELAKKDRVALAATEALERLKAAQEPAREAIAKRPADGGDAARAMEKGSAVAKKAAPP